MLSARSFTVKKMKIKLSKRLVRIHQFRLVLLSDTLLSQDRIYGGAPVQFYSGAGGGIRADPLSAILSH
jgi:hypothetical protein